MFHHFQRLEKKEEGLKFNKSQNNLDERDLNHCTLGYQSRTLPKELQSNSIIVVKFDRLYILMITKMCEQFQCVNSETCCVQFKHIKVKFAATSKIIQNIVFKQVL